jgi:arginase
MPSLAIIGAPSSIGIKPYDDGTARGLDQAPNALRELGIVRRLGATDRGDVVPPPYRDFTRPAGRTRNEDDVADYSRALGHAVAAAATAHSFVVTLGGDCSIVLGCLMGFKHAGRSRLGLVYFDAHADFATPEVSRSGSAASMCLGLAVGRGDTHLAHLDGSEPLVRPQDVVVIGRRDDADAPIYGQDALRTSGILDLRQEIVREKGGDAIAAATLQRLEANALDGFWIHVDADALDPSVVPAVDSPEPGGLGLDELVAILAPLARHPLALGLELTIYDPVLDPDRSSARGLVELLERALAHRKENSEKDVS